MQMIGEHDKRVDRECMTSPSRRNGIAQGLDMIDEQGMSTVQEVDREEPGAAWDERATIVRHKVQGSTAY
jgi:hypothetical protein